MKASSSNANLRLEGRTLRTIVIISSFLPDFCTTDLIVTQHGEKDNKLKHFALTVRGVWMRLPYPGKYSVCPQTRLFEFLSCAYACWWTFLLSMPVHLFATNLAFLGLSNMAGANLWALATGSVAAVQAGGWLLGRPSLRWLGLSLAALLWVFITTGIYRASPFWGRVPVNTGFGIYGVSATINFYCAVFILPRFLLPEIYILWFRCRGGQVERT